MFSRPPPMQMLKGFFVALRLAGMPSHFPQSLVTSPGSLTMERHCILLIRPKNHQYMWYPFNRLGQSPCCEACLSYLTRVSGRSFREASISCPPMHRSPSGISISRPSKCAESLKLTNLSRTVCQFRPIEPDNADIMLVENFR
jgi:hypothetical protein